MEKISFAFPVCNEEENVELLYWHVKEAAHQANVDYEMVFVDDGSNDNSLSIIKRLREKDRKVEYVSLSRNFGHQNAIFAGMSFCSGDAVITMDSDLQHPASLIPKMIGIWREGAEVVYTVKENANLGRLKKTIIKSFYWFISRVSGLKLNFGQSDFRLLDKKVLKVILDMPECHKFLRGQVSWIGFKQKGISYNVQKRHGGKAKFSYKSLYELALDGIFSFGRYPLHLVMIFGLIIFSFSLIYIFLLSLVWFLKLLRVVYISMPPGWTTLVMAIFLLSSIQLMIIGVLGEYVGRIYDQAKHRPVFIVRENSKTGE